MDLCSPHKAQKRTGVAPSTIHKWVAAGHLPVYPASNESRARYPGAVLVSVADVCRERDYRATVVSARAAGEIIDVAETTIVYYCNRGYLEYRRRGKLYEIELVKLERFVERHAGEVGRPRLPKPAERECELPGCQVRFTPSAGNVRRGYGRFHSHDHYAQDLKRRCREGTLVLPLMVVPPRAKQRWEGRFAGKRGGRPPAPPLEADFLRKVDELRALGWGRRTIAKRLDAKEHHVRQALAELALARQVAA